MSLGDIGRGLESATSSSACRVACKGFTGAGGVGGKSSKGEPKMSEVGDEGDMVGEYNGKVGGYMSGRTIVKGRP